MSEQRAIELLEYIRRVGNGESPYCRCAQSIALNMAIEALEKQIPKKPDYEGDGYWNGELVYDTWICPYCEKKYEVDYEEYDYCPNCGQAIDWSERNG